MVKTLEQQGNKVNNKWKEINAYFKRYILPTLKKPNKFELDTENQSRLLESILVTASKDNNYMLPTEGKFILSEFINGMLDYLGRENRRRVEYRTFNGTESDFEGRIEGNYLSQIKKAPKKLTPKIKGLTNVLIKFRWADPGGPDRGYPYTKLGNLFEESFSPPVMYNSTFKINNTLVTDCNKKIIPSFSESERKDMEGIAKSMQKYIKKDIEYIKENKLRPFLPISVS